MQSSLVIAQILGPMFVIVAVSVLLNTSTYQHIFERFSENSALAYLGGLLGLILGLVILAFHHTWSTDWTVIVTLIGWLELIGGCLLLVCPSAIFRLSRPLMAPVWLRTYAAVLPVLGLFLSVKGYELI